MKTTIGTTPFGFSSYVGEPEAALVPTQRQVQHFAALLVSDEEAHVARSTSTETSWQTVQSLPLSPQDFALRVVNGPLAGMVLRAWWCHDRLEIRFEAGDAAQAQRLNKHQQALVSVLEPMLGVKVQIRVDDGVTA